MGALGGIGVGVVVGRMGGELGTFGFACDGSDFTRLPTPKSKRIFIFCYPLFDDPI